MWGPLSSTLPYLAPHPLSGTPYPCLVPHLLSGTPTPILYSIPIWYPLGRTGWHETTLTSHQSGILHSLIVLFLFLWCKCAEVKSLHSANSRNVIQNRENMNVFRLCREELGKSISKENKKHSTVRLGSRGMLCRQGRHANKKAFSSLQSCLTGSS